MAVVETRHGEIEGTRANGAEIFWATSFAPPCLDVGFQSGDRLDPIVSTPAADDARRGSPVRGGAAGGCHAIEQPFVAGRVNHAEQLIAGGPDVQTFGEGIMDIRLGSARSGEPGWTPYDSVRRGTMVLGPECEVVEAPLDAEPAAWDGLY